MNTLLTGKYLLPGDGSIKKSWGIAFSDSRIDAVGPNEELLRKFSGYHHIDLTDKIISPGFINSHMHMYGILSHGITPPVPIDGFETFLNDFWWPLVENRIDHQMIKVTSRATALELLESGVTSLCDVLEAPKALPGALRVEAEALSETGIRAVLSFESCERIDTENGLQGLEENARFFGEYRNHPLISGMMCTHTTFTCSKEFIRKADEMARRLGSGLQFHLNESAYEPEWCRKEHGMYPVELYRELGVLGDHVLASQGVKLAETEMDILAEANVGLVHVPLSNCEVGGGFSPVPDLLERGINVGLGTDGYINNFFEVMRGAFLMHKAARENPETMPAKSVLRLATANGAKAMGNPEVGMLKEGFVADIIAINSDFPTPLNEENIFDQLILYRNPRDVSEVFVAGKQVKKGSRMIGISFSDMKQEVKKEAERLWSFR